MDLKRIARGVGANAFSAGAPIVLQLVTVPVLVHLWGLQGFGVWLLLSTIPGYLSMTALGLSSAAGNDMTAAFASGEVETARRILSTTAITLAAICAVVFAVAAVVIGRLPPGWFGADVVRLSGSLTAVLWAFVAYTLAWLQIEVVQGGYRATGRYALGTFGVGLCNVGERLAVLLAAWAGGGILWAALGMATVRVLAAAVLWLRFRVLHPELRPRRSDWSAPVFRRILKLASAVMLLPLATGLNLQGSLLLLGATAGPAAVGLFGALRTLSRIVLQATNIVSTAVMPDFSMAVGRDDLAAKRKIFALNLAAGLAISAGVFAFFALFGPWIADLWLPGRVGSANPGLLMLLAAGALVLGFWNGNANLLLAANRQVLYTPHYVVASAVGLAVAWLPASRGSLVGVAAVLLAVDLVMAAHVFRQLPVLGVGSVRDSLRLAGATAARWLRARRSTG